MLFCLRYFCHTDNFLNEVGDPVPSWPKIYLQLQLCIILSPSQNPIYGFGYQSATSDVKLTQKEVTIKVKYLLVLKIERYEIWVERWSYL